MNTMMNNAAAINEMNKEGINMHNVLETLMFKAHMQKQQLERARKAWVSAETPAAKKVAEKAGNNAKKKLSELREQYRKAAAGMMAVAPIMPVKKEEAKKTIETVKKTPVVTSQKGTEEEKIRTKYSELRKDVRARLDAAYKKEIEELKAKYVAKEKEELQTLKEQYEAEIASIGKEVITTPIEVPPQEISDPGAAEDEPILLDTFQVGDRVYETHGFDSDELLYVENLEEREAMIAEAIKNGMLEEIKNDDQQFDGKKAVLYPGSIFKTGSGNHYLVSKTFNIAKYRAVDTQEKQRMVNVALKLGAIEKTKGVGENYLFACDMVEIEEPAAQQDDIPAPVYSEEEPEEAPAVEDLGILYEDETFKFDGRTYTVRGSFDMEIFSISTKEEQEAMIAEAIACKDVELA